MTDVELNSTRRAHSKRCEILAWKRDGGQGEVAVPSVNVEEKRKAGASSTKQLLAFGGNQKLKSAVSSLNNQAPAGKDAES